MTVTAAQRLAAVRPVRRAAAQRTVRALRVLLFLGGLAVLGFAFGGQAHAAEQPGATPSPERVAGAVGPAGQFQDAVRTTSGSAASGAAQHAVQRIAGSASYATLVNGRGGTADPGDTTGTIDADGPAGAGGPVQVDADRPAPGDGPGVRQPAESLGRGVTGAAQPDGPGTVRAVRHPAGDVVVSRTPLSVPEPSVERVLLPAVRVVGQSVHGAAEPLAGVASAVVRAVSVQPLPAPAWPGSGLPLPGRDRPQDTAPVTGHREEPRSGALVGRARTADAVRGLPRAHRCTVTTASEYRQGAADAHLVPVLDSGADGGRVPELPGRAPAGPCGSAVLQTAGDGHTPRPGDQHGAWFSDAMAVGSLSASREPAVAAGLRDRHRDIPEFPG